MRFPRFRNPLLRLAIVFFALVLVPSFLLGYFSLQAVESARAAAHRRWFEDHQRYAQFAGRAVRGELEALEAAWEALVPRSVGWESRLQEMRASLDAARGKAFVRACHLLHVSGRLLYPAAEGGQPDEAQVVALAAPKVEEAERFQELLAAAEAAEFDTGDAEAALGAYRSILAEVSTPRLRAIGHAGVGRVLLERGDWDAAIGEYGQILQLYPDARDLDNQPLRLQARLQIARALEARQEPLAAARTLVDLYEDLVGHSDEIGSLPYEILVERIERRMARLVPRPPPTEWEEVKRRYAAARARPKQQLGPDYFVHKLSRKLIRASLDGLAYSTQLRYLSDTVDGEPFLHVYLYLPDASGAGVAGLAALEIGLPGLSQALLPGILRRLELSGDLGLAVVDEAGRPVIGAATGGAGVATSNLGEPFDFWNVAVYRRPEAGDSGIDFRAKVFLYVVLLLLVTLGTGAALVVVGLRRQSRLAQLKTGFVSNVSHELRTPLTSIRMYTEMLEMGGERLGAEERARQLGTIRRECDRLQRLIDAVLDFARIERGAKEYRFEYEEIGPLVGGIAEEFRGQAEAEGFDYRVSIEPDLPELRVDADAVRQMLLNLLSNAVKYSDAERAIAVHVFRQGAEVALQVEDHGIGIAAEEQERIFEDFYRVDTRLSDRRGGVGLGLTLVRRMAAAHGGRVTLESERGRGSRFTIWLPLEPPAERRPAAGGLAEARRG
jgi:signal transduction histidine kinase